MCLSLQSLFFCASSAPSAYCQTLFSVLCLCPYFTAWVQCAGRIVLSFTVIWEFQGKHRMTKKRNTNLGEVLPFQVAQHTTQQQGRKNYNEWPRHTVEEFFVICRVMTVLCRVWVVKWILLNCCKKWLMGTFSQAQNKETCLTLTE